MKKNMIALTVFVVAVMLATEAFAMGGCGPCGRHDKHRRAKEAFCAKLNLSAEQQKLLDEQRSTRRQEMDSLRGSIKEKKNALRDALKKPGVTRQDVQPIVAEIKDLQARMLEKKVDGIFAVKSILTPEQFARLEEMKDKKMRGRFGRKGPGRWGE